MYCCHCRCRCYHRLKQKNVFCSIWQTTLCKYATPEKKRAKANNNRSNKQFMQHTDNFVVKKSSECQHFFRFFCSVYVYVCMDMYVYARTLKFELSSAWICNIEKQKRERKKDDSSWLFITLFNVLVHSVVISLV